MNTLKKVKKMPKGKKCKVCNDGRMRRDYIRTNHKGYRFTETNPEGTLVNKGKYKPVGWLCDKCGTFIPDKDQFLIYRGWTERKEKSIELLQNFRKIQWELAEYQNEYKYTKKEMKREKKFLEKYHKFLYYKRAIIWYSAKGTRAFLKGLKEGGKISDKNWEEKLEREKLTDDQILQKAKLIQNRKNLGY